MRSTLELLVDLAGQVRDLMRVELSLASAEISEGARRIPASLGAVVAGAILFTVGLGLILTALGLSLLRFGLPLDLSFAIVAAVCLIASLILVWVGAAGLKPSRLVPAKSIAQITSLLGGV